MNKHFKSAQVHSHLATAALASQLRKHQALLKIVRAALPDKLTDRVADCVLSGRKLLVYAYSANWASQVRFHHASILEAVNAAACEPIDAVVTRIQQPVEEHRTTTLKARLPSAGHIEEIRAAARNIADETLRQAVERLGATLKRAYEDRARP